MRSLIALTLLLGFVATVRAHHPDRENQRVHPRIDLIGPLGTRLPPSYRRVYNRPTSIGGKIAYYIAPSSQEAMAWHNATHRGYYRDHRPRIEMHYFYPKPWEALKIGARRPTVPGTTETPLEYEFSPEYEREAAEAAELVPELIEPQIAPPGEQAPDIDLPIIDSPQLDPRGMIEQ
jgi:hypothetical protein